MKSSTKTARIDLRLIDEIKRISKKNEIKFIEASKLAALKLSRLNGKKERFKFIEEIEF